MADRLQHMIDAEIRKGYSYDGAYLEVYDGWKHLTAHFSDFYDENSPVFRGIQGGGKRTDAVQASLFDAIHAEMLGEKDARRAKYMRTHGKDKTPKDRKRDKKNRNRRMYGREEQWASFRFNPEDPLWCRGGWDWWNGREGQKNPMNPEMDIFRNRRQNARMDSLRDDWNNELQSRTDAAMDALTYLELALDHALNLTSINNNIDSMLCYVEMVDKLRDDANYERIRAEEMKAIAESIMEGEMY